MTCASRIGHAISQIKTKNVSTITMETVTSQNLSFSTDTTDPISSKESLGDSVCIFSSDGSTSVDSEPSSSANKTAVESTSSNAKPTSDKHKEESDMIKERFARLLLGEDMSGGSKGVSTALAISNAITNLSASVFGNLWKLEPLDHNLKLMWKREMNWLLSVTDHIVELVPKWQSLADGTKVEIMVASHRQDLQINLPALRKLDMMLLECLDSFKSTEFWYVDQEHMVCCNDVATDRSVMRHEEKCWLPIPEVSSTGLCEESKKMLKHQKENTNQIFKAAMSMNMQALSEMEVPSSYIQTLPKNGKEILGEIYDSISLEHLSADDALRHLEISHEKSAIEAANRIEAAIYVWNHKVAINSKASSYHVHRRKTFVERANALLRSLRVAFPGLPRTLLDMHKIQHNKDIGQSIVESYSRALESVALKMGGRIEEVLKVDDRICAHLCLGDYMRLDPFTKRIYESANSTKILGKG